MVQFKDFNVRDDAQIRHVIHRSNVVINLIGSDVETMNYSFEEVHVDIARRIAKAAKENPLTERFLHVSCLGASESATSRRLKTKVTPQDLKVPCTSLYELVSGESK
jgi:NADH dehydrogenase (ubiquinone) 1 alpha subcomplex subunit 9